MSDFIALEWVKQPVDGEAATAIRKDMRTYRREKGRGGHRFALGFLKTVWVADDGRHVVLNHVDDAVWQMFYRHPSKGWSLINWHPTRREAQAAAESNHPELVDTRPKARPGLNVLAGWPGESFSMRVHCHSEYTATVIEDAYAKIGCITQRDVLAGEVA